MNAQFVSERPPAPAVPADWSVRAADLAAASRSLRAGLERGVQVADLEVELSDVYTASLDLVRAVGDWSTRLSIGALVASQTATHGSYGDRAVIDVLRDLAADLDLIAALADLIGKGADR